MSKLKTEKVRKARSHYPSLTLLESRETLA